MSVRIVVGDCCERLAEMQENSIDSCVCDPPYGLEFMGQDWDAPWKYTIGQTGYQDAKRLPRPSFSSSRNPMCRNCHRHKRGSRNHQRCLCEQPEFDDVDQRVADMRVFQSWCEQWARQVYRVLKPGGYLAAFGGTRTYHRMVCAIEDVGFEIRDSIGVGLPGLLAWIHGQGFPKSKSLRDIGRPELGTALKPAWEPIVLARKALSEPTVAANVLAHGTGALNVDGCRVDCGSRANIVGHPKHGNFRGAFREGSHQEGITTSGRWSPNLLLSHTPECRRLGSQKVKGSRVKPCEYRGQSGYGGGLDGNRPSRGIGDANNEESVAVWDCAEGCPVRVLGEQSGEHVSSGGSGPASKTWRGSGYTVGASLSGATGGLGDKGTAARFFPQFAFEPDVDVPFFYTPKPAKRERERGLEAQPDRTRHRVNPGGLEHEPRWAPVQRKNHHPTVKSVALCRWLCRLITPPGGTVLDCFMGSGSVGVAALREGFSFIGIEREAEYAEIAQGRIKGDCPMFTEIEVSG